jgi:hypothetical protein
MGMNEKVASLASQLPTQDEHEVRAAALNAVLTRGRQLGRMFFTAEDAKVAETMVRTMMMLKPVGDGVREGAPQTMPSHVSIPAVAAVERVLMDATGEAKEVA